MSSTPPNSNQAHVAPSSNDSNSGILPPNSPASDVIQPNTTQDLPSQQINHNAAVQTRPQGPAQGEFATRQLPTGTPQGQALSAAQLSGRTVEQLTGHYTPGYSTPGFGTPDTVQPAVAPQPSTVSAATSTTAQEMPGRYQPGYTNLPSDPPHQPQRPSEPQMQQAWEAPSQQGMDTPYSPGYQRDQQATTHFGYRQVPVSEKQQRVAQVFHSVASKYDLMNDLMSFGIHRLWKQYTITLSGVRRGQMVLDLAGGTGDLALAFSRKVGAEGRVVLSDINESMLAVGRDRLLNKGCYNVDFVLANAETLTPFPDNTFDLVTISFGLRNVTDKDAALRAMYRVLKPGGRLLILEFSKPVFEPLSRLYDLYSFTALPVMGKLVANDSESYRYLAESIRMHPDQYTLKQMMERAGFIQCDYHNLTGGIVALHRGFK